MTQDSLRKICDVGSLISAVELQLLASDCHAHRGCQPPCCEGSVIAVLPSLQQLLCGKACADLL